jgi:predicted molibdopterin-dependent oxidoreductase YjgC
MSGPRQGRRAGQLVRLAATERRPIRLTMGERTIEALEGDTLLTALLLAGPYLRRFEFGEGMRAGFCLMGACQDCWVTLADGRRLRACTTLAEDGMALEPIPSEPIP